MEFFKIYLLVNLFALALCSDISLYDDFENVRGCLENSTELINLSDADEPEIVAKGLESKIVGGFQTTIDENPWQVSLLRMRFSFWGIRSRHVCGGVIIAPQWVITAAHCTRRRSARDYAVRVGSTDNTFGGSVIRVQQFIRHELYRRRTIDYDVSLAQLATTVNYNNQIQPIALPNIDSVFADNTTCLASGWGATMNPNEPRNILRAVNLPIVNQDYCNSQYGGRITPQMICAGFQEGGKDTCFGDSGGPLTCQQNGEKQLVGIVSFGRGCARPNYPGVYVRLTAVRDWIQNRTGI